MPVMISPFKIDTNVTADEVTGRIAGQNSAAMMSFTSSSVCRSWLACLNSRRMLLAPFTSQKRSRLNYLAVKLHRHLFVT
jgi:hypothetical protein